MEKKIGHKIYKTQDQIEFANLSKDYNDIHINKFASRKLIFGKQIVHGVNILLTSLKFLKKSEHEIKNIKCDFLEPVFLNEKVEFFLKENNNNKTILVKYKKETKTIISFDIAYDIDGNISLKLTKIKKNLIYRNKFFINEKLFYLKKFFNEAQIKELLSLSFFIGMVYPGKYSLISQLNINFKKIWKKNNYICFKIIKFDKRINKSLIKFQGNIFGNILAYSYKLPTSPNVKNLKRKSLDKILINKNSLIIGGSRGLGEITGKILSVMGSNIYLTYYMNKIEAHNIKDEIQKNTKAKCKVVKLNVLNKKFFIQIKNYKNVDYIFYFATPKILNTKYFDIKLFNYYKKIYCNKLYQMCKILNTLSNKKIKVFFPSTIFLNYNSKKFKEYTEAKKLAEKLIKKINKKLKNIKIYSIRLPEMDTSQNISIFKKTKVDNVKIMVPIIKNFIKND